jgi:hypothetical protein
MKPAPGGRRGARGVARDVELPVLQRQLPGRRDKTLINAVVVVVVLSQLFSQCSSQLLLLLFCTSPALPLTQRRVNIL